MRKLALACLLLGIAAQARAYGYWNDVRFSALLPGGAITVRMENPSGAGVENRLLYADGGLLEQTMTPVADGPSTLEATVPGPTAGSRFYGFRLVQGAELDLMPVPIPDGASPVPEDLTRLTEDATGDHLFSYVNLDIVDCHVSFSGTKLFAALRNAGGGFPVSQGLTFFGYLFAIANPALADPDTVFAIMQTYNQPGIISPGLYKITGSGFGDLLKIGDISVQEFPAINTLLLSCNRADLEADPYFQSWYDPSDPALGVAGFTQRITILGGAAEADRSPGGRCYLRQFSITSAENNPPALGNLAVEGTGAEARALVDYDDADGHCPVLSEIVIDGVPYPMRPLTLDYGLPVAYATDAGIEPLASDSWTEAVARFSDDGENIVEAEIRATGVAEEDAFDHPPDPVLSIAPNPFNATAAITYTMPAAGRLRIAIYDVRGGLVRTLLDGEAAAGRAALTWDGRNGRGLQAASGVYYCMMTAPEGTCVRKLLLVR